MIGRIGRVLGKWFLIAVTLLALFSVLALTLTAGAPLLIAHAAGYDAAVPFGISGQLRLVSMLAPALTLFALLALLMNKLEAQLTAKTARRKSASRRRGPVSR